MYYSCTSLQNWKKTVSIAFINLYNSIMYWQKTTREKFRTDFKFMKKYFGNFFKNWVSPVFLTTQLLSVDKCKIIHPEFLTAVITKENNFVYTEGGQLFQKTPCTALFTLKRNYTWFLFPTAPYSNKSIKHKCANVSIIFHVYQDVFSISQTMCLVYVKRHSAFTWNS